MSRPFHDLPCPQVPLTLPGGKLHREAGRSSPSQLRHVPYGVPSVVVAGCRQERDERGRKLVDRDGLQNDQAWARNLCIEEPFSAEDHVLLYIYY